MINNKLQNSIYIQPSESVVNLWKNYCEVPKNLPIISFAFGVDTYKFNEVKFINNRTKIMFYFKQRNPDEFILILNRWLIQNQNQSYIVYDYSKKYEEENFINDLHDTKYCIWIGRHESQGFALQEILACNVPILIWDVTRLSQEWNCPILYKSYDLCVMTCAPYWDEQCGVKFQNLINLNNHLKNLLQIWNPIYTEKIYSIIKYNKSM